MARTKFNTPPHDARRIKKKEDLETTTSVFKILINKMQRDKIIDARRKALKMLAKDRNWVVQQFVCKLPTSPNHS